MFDPQHADAPGGGTGGGRSDHMVAGSVTPILAERADARTDAAAVFENVYAVLVTGKIVRRHIYLNLPAAQRAAERARARGADADLVLVRLVPVAGAVIA